MSYDLSLIARTVKAALRKRPQARLRDISRQLAVDPHTAEKALRVCGGCGFRVLRRRALLRSAGYLLRTVPPLSIKQVAASLGYSSSRAFSRFVLTTLGKTPSQLRAIGRK